MMRSQRNMLATGRGSCTLHPMGLVAQYTAYSLGMHLHAMHVLLHPCPAQARRWTHTRWWRGGHRNIGH